jgi:DNA-directed RNA polymerase I, II, and III subunit RPABC2
MSRLINRWNLYALNFYEPVKFDDLNSMIQGRAMADEEDVEYEEYDAEEYDGVELPEEEVGSEMKPELKKLYQQHPECMLDYVEQVLPKIPLQIAPPGGSLADENHRTYPFLTIFERTKIIGLRANQISRGSAPFVAVPKHITDVRDIARLELEQKRIPFIVKRPLPNGSFEYWRLSDLLLL